MQKDEIITIRTNGDVKKMVEDAKLNSGQTAGDWLKQAVLAWQEKHDIVTEQTQPDSIHILAGRKALGELNKIMEALENVGKQTLELNRADNVQWQSKYSLLETKLTEQEKEHTEKLSDNQNVLKDYEKKLSESERIIAKQSKQIESLQVQQDSIKDLSKHLEQERTVNVKLYNQREKSEQDLTVCKDELHALTAEHKAQQILIQELQLKCGNAEQAINELHNELFSKERRIMELSVDKKYHEDIFLKMQENIKKITVDYEALKADNMTLVKEKSELLGELNGLRKSIM